MERVVDRERIAGDESVSTDRSAILAVQEVAQVDLGLQFPEDSDVHALIARGRIEREAANYVPFVFGTLALDKLTPRMTRIDAPRTCGPRTWTNRKPFRIRADVSLLNRQPPYR